MDFLQGLNTAQQQAVMAANGPVLVMAGPGSGKTRVLTQRIAYLIGRLGVRPYNILAVTFTNKAAREMEKRVETLLGGSARGLTLGTFHGVCARILRREAEHLPINGNFVIFDADDQQNVVKQILKELNIDDKQHRPQAVHAAISNAKNELRGPAEYPIKNYRDQVVQRVYERYQQALLASNAVDFDDLLLYTAQLLDTNPQVRERYARRFEHVLVDEFQDTNMAQYQLLTHLASFHRNLYCVGDVDQCLPAGTPIHTPQGALPIETLQPENLVTAASGRSHSLPARILHTGSREYQGDLISITTQSGATLRATPNHILFARLGIQPGWHYVYLMYRKDKGYRVGVASHARSDGTRAELQIGLKVRSVQENADKIWVLKVCDKREDAVYWEAYFAFRYGLPTTVFHVCARRMNLTQAHIDRLYTEIDTFANTEKLFADLQMDFRYPHYTAQGTHRNLINLRYFGDTRRSAQSPWHAHRVDLWSNDLLLAQTLRSAGYNTRRAARDNWRVGINRIGYDDVHTAAQQLSQAAGGLEIITGAFLTQGKTNALTPRFSLMPASHLHPSMQVAIEHNGQIIQDTIVSVTRTPYTGQVYDLEVENLHNYIAGGVVVHNSIYGWRGADYRNLQRFQQDYPDSQVILLEQNYRSTQNILDAAMAVIDKNPHRIKKQLFTERGGGAKVILHEAYDDREEAHLIVQTIAEKIAAKNANPGDFAIMYRTNAQSRVLEEAFVRANLPYKIVGAQRFYGRREVKDVLAYLRVAYNPDDEVSLTRIINVPARNIGAKTIETLRQIAQNNQQSSGRILLQLASATADAPLAAAFSGRALNSLKTFAISLANWHALAAESEPQALLDRILEESQYRAYIEDGSDEGRDRWENVLELRRLAAEYAQSGLATFLEQIALVSDQDTLQENNANLPTLLTLHAAKGLEFPIVFIAGLNDGILPHLRSFDDPEAMMEERRLLYVGITRAENLLYLMYSQMRATYGYADYVEPSRFLGDLPPALLTDLQGRNRGGKRGGAVPKETARPTSAPAPAPRWDSAPTPKKPAASGLQFPAGIRVEHPTWGVGLILASQPQNGDEVLDIFFEEVGMKRVLASMAKLQRVTPEK